MHYAPIYRDQVVVQALIFAAWPSEEYRDTKFSTRRRIYRASIYRDRISTRGRWSSPRNARGNVVGTQHFRACNIINVMLTPFAFYCYLFLPFGGGRREMSYCRRIYYAVKSNTAEGVFACGNGNRWGRSGGRSHGDSARRCFIFRRNLVGPNVQIFGSCSMKGRGALLRAVLSLARKFAMTARSTCR